MRKLISWICIILFLVLAVKMNPTKLDFIKHIRDNDQNLKFPMIKGETQEFTSILNFRIFSIYKFTKTEHMDFVNHDTNQVFIETYNGAYKEFAGVYLGLFKSFVELKSKTTVDK